jgi:hypothetical protein
MGRSVSGIPIFDFLFSIGEAVGLTTLTLFNHSGRKGCGVTRGEQLDEYAIEEWTL